MPNPDGPMFVSLSLFFSLCSNYMTPGLLTPKSEFEIHCCDRNINIDYVEVNE